MDTIEKKKKTQTQNKKKQQAYPHMLLEKLLKKAFSLMSDFSLLYRV